MSESRDFVANERVRFALSGVGTERRGVVVEQLETITIVRWDGERKRSPLPLPPTCSGWSDDSRYADQRGHDVFWMTARKSERERECSEIVLSSLVARASSVSK